MKKFILLFFVTATVSIVNAQSRDFKDRAYTGSHNAYSLNMHEKKALLRKIDNEYDGRILAVKRSRRLSSREKSKIISSLKREREQRVDQVKSGFSKNDRYRDVQYGKKW